MSDELKFRLGSGDEISLPVSVLSHGLTAAELGTVLLFEAISEGHIGLDHDLIADPGLQGALKNLKERGIIKAELVGNVVKIEVNLETL